MLISGEEHNQFFIGSYLEDRDRINSRTQLPSSRDPATSRLKKSSRPTVGQNTDFLDLFFSPLYKYF